MKAIIFTTILFLLTLHIQAQVPYDDKRHLLDDERINPTFAAKIKLFLDSAQKRGFKPVVNQAFRSREEAEELNKKNSKLGKAAAKISVHSFGLAVDIWLANDKGEIFSYDGKEYELNKKNRFPFATWLKFIKIGESFALVNAHKHNDSDHWELHPNWSKTDWVNAEKKALPIYNKESDLSELERLQLVWKNAGL